MESVPVSPRGDSTWQQRRRSSRSLNFTARCCLTAGSLTNSRGYLQIESRSDTPPLVQDWGQPTSSWTLLAHVASRPNPEFNSDIALLEQALEDLLSNNPSLSERYKYQGLVGQIKLPLRLSGHASMRPRHTPGPWRNSRRPMEAWSAGSA